METAEVESTHLLSADRTREYVSGLIEPGMMDFTQRYDDAAYARADGLRGVQKTFTIEWFDGGSAEFDGYVKQVTSNVTAPDAVQDIQVFVKRTGAITFSEGA